MALRLKRIIDGKTYNTETATQLASWSSANNPDTAHQQYEHGGILFQTRFGAYFVVQYDEGQDPWDDNYEKLIPLEPEQAQRWAEKHCSADDVEALFGEMPEAGEAEAKLTLRMPDALRKRLVVLAEGQKQSLNAWIVRCLEGCAESALKKRQVKRRLS